MVKGNQFRLGLFVLGGILLLAVLVFYLGLAEALAPKLSVVSLFRESVQGLAVGSQVKYKGVPVGSVSAIRILTKEKLIEVEMAIDPRVFVAEKKALWMDDDGRMDFVREFFRDETGSGLRCQLEYAGITGMKYVEMNYFESDDKFIPIDPPLDLESNTVYIASMPSLFSNLSETVGVALDKIAKIDFDGMADELQDSLNEFNALLTDPALRNTLYRLEEISGHIETASKSLAETLTDTEIRKIINGIDENLSDLSQLSRSLQSQLMQADLVGLSNRFATMTDSIRELALGMDGSRGRFDNTLQRLNRLLELVGDTVSTLGNDPNSVLRGKRVPQAEWEK